MPHHPVHRRSIHRRVRAKQQTRLGCLFVLFDFAFESLLPIFITNSSLSRARWILSRACRYDPTLEDSYVRQPPQLRFSEARALVPFGLIPNLPTEKTNYHRWQRVHSRHLRHSRYAHPPLPATKANKHCNPLVIRKLLYMGVNSNWETPGTSIATVTPHV